MRTKDQINVILRAKEIQHAHGITFGEALVEAQAMAYV